MGVSKALRTQAVKGVLCGTKTSQASGIFDAPLDDAALITSHRTQHMLCFWNTWLGFGSFLCSTFVTAPLLVIARLELRWQAVQLFVRGAVKATAAYDGIYENRADNWVVLSNVMDNFGNRQQSRNVGSPFFNVAEQPNNGHWSAPGSDLVYREPSRNHAVSIPEVRSHPDVAGSLFYPELELVDPSPNDAVEPWNNSQSINIQHSVPLYPSEGRPVPLPTPIASSLVLTSNRLTHFVNDSEPPWLPSGIVPIINQNKGPYYRSTDTSDLGFRAGPGSDCYYLSDSGYQTAGQTQSVADQSYHGFSPDLGTLDAQFIGFDMNSLRDSQPEDGSDDSLDSPDPVANTPVRAQKSTRGGKRQCKQCDKVLKCPSDFKKHMLIHEKPHKCEVPGCTRVEGFGTVNDLDRHKASVHKILKNTRKFKCAAPGCKTAEKIWPRLDNFKQHLERMHKGMDVNSLIERSEAKASASSHIAGSMTMGNDLDGVGAGAGSSIPTGANMDPDDLPMHNQPTAFTYLNGPPRRGSDNAMRTFGHGQSSQRANGLHMLSDVAEVHPNLRSDQTQDQTRALVIKGPIVNKNSSTSANFSHSDANHRTLKQAPTSVEGLGPRTSTNSRSSSDEDSSSSRTAPIRCPYPKCNKMFKRRCELNKHEKRHTLPYVCTALGCSHRSGSKSDWQRHERTCGQQGRESFHDQNDTIRVCLEANSLSATGKCGFMHTSQATFETHLKEIHSITDEKKLEACMRRYQPPDHGPGIGWCGFCVALVQWAEPNAIGDRKNFQEGYGKYTDRADHIDHHVTKEAKSMDHYVSLEFHLRKEDATKDKLQSWFRDEHRALSINPRISNFVPKNPKKRRRGADGYGSSDDEHKKKISEANWSCCQCGTTQLYKLYGRCSDINCDHTRCQLCEDGKDSERSKEAMKEHMGLPGRIDQRPPWDAQAKYGLMAS